jgi:ATP-dependent exoDNAse (exonuclease V) beta subunit
MRADSLVKASDVFRAWVAQRWPGAIWHREIAIDGVIASEHGERHVTGIIDLLLEMRDEYVVVDHKTFAGKTEAAWRAKCASFIPQLAAYSRLLGSVSNRRRRRCWVHLPVGGGMVEVVLDDSSQRKRVGC